MFKKIKTSATPISPEGNTIDVVKKALKFFEVPVNDKTVTEYLKTHPDYPTFKSISDAFKEWKIKHYPTKLSIAEFRELNHPCIIHLAERSGKIAFITDIKHNIVTYFDSHKKPKKISIEELFQKSSGYAIFLTPDEQSGEYNYREKRRHEQIRKAIIPTVITLFFLLAVFPSLLTFTEQGLNITKFQSFLIFTKVIGVLLSILLLFHELKVHNYFGDKICSINKQVDCKSILKTRASKLFGWISWADAGVIYFSGSMIILLQNLYLPNYGLLAVLSLSAMPYPFFSIYYQARVIKKWCLLCLGVQLLLIIEFLLLSHKLFDIHLSLSNVLNFLFTFFIISVVYLVTRSYFILYRDNINIRFNYNLFKRNYEVFKALLLKGNFHSDLITERSLIFGAKNASVSITAFLSLHCGSCARVFTQVKNLLAINNELSVNIILADKEETDKISQRMIYNLYYLYFDVDKNKALSFIEDWYSTSLHSLDSTYTSSLTPDFIEEIKQQNLKLIKKCNISSAPAFLINGYQLPLQYEISDVSLFFEIIKQLKL